MSLKIVRNDISKMNVDVIVNTASPDVDIGPGCDFAVYSAAGPEELLAYRRENIGSRNEGDVFVTPGFKLPAKYIIHAVSPLYRDGNSGEEELLRTCYRRALQKFSGLKAEPGMGSCPSIAFPLISTGSFGYPKEEGLRIALDEINSFFINTPGNNSKNALANNPADTPRNSLEGATEKSPRNSAASEADIYIVVFYDESFELGRRVAPGLKEYINRNYVEERPQYVRPEFDMPESEKLRSSKPSFLRRLFGNTPDAMPSAKGAMAQAKNAVPQLKESMPQPQPSMAQPEAAKPTMPQPQPSMAQPEAAKPTMPQPQPSMAQPEAAKPTMPQPMPSMPQPAAFSLDSEEAFDELKKRLDERKQHLADSFSEYLLFLIEQKGMTNVEVYKRAIVDKKLFAKIKNDNTYHPQKLTCLCLCVGAKLNLDETRDLLARAGYALSPCDMRDIIFSYFIENEIYDMVELDIQLEEYDLPPIIA